MRYALAALLLLLLAHPARAELRACNRTSYVLEAASSTIRNTESLTQGWTRITPGDCAVLIKGALGPASYLVYARSALAHAGPPRAWGGAFPVCVKDGNFLLHQAVTQPYCTQADTFALPFAPVNLKGQDWRMDFDEAPALADLTAAQLAGVKRLLGDNGYKIGAIDGAPSKPTGAALTDFRKRAGLKPADGNSQLFAALEKRAATKSAPQGYAICNDSREPLLAAIAQTGPGKPGSRGWWRIAPGACARALADSLGGKPVYLLAQKLNGTALVGGAEKFCTGATAFAVEGRDCAAHDMSEAGFVATAGGGLSGYIAHIGAAGLKH